MTGLPNQADVTTIVVNWNLKEETTRCLESLEKSSLSTRVVLVDNGSLDGSAPYLEERFPELDIIRLQSNIGFGRACNLAIQRALAENRSQYIFLLNNDAFIHPQALFRLVEAAQSNPTAGILGPKIYYRQDPSQIWYAGARRRRGVLAAADTGRGQIDKGQFETTRKVDYVFGAAMLIQREVFERVGFFDERFFIYLEDLDFCLRAQQAGFSPLFVPQAHVWHSGSASTARYLHMRRYHHFRSTMIFLVKHLTPVWVLPATAFWGAVLLRSLGQDLLTADLVGAWRVLPSRNGRQRGPTA
jgi:GT2 family glycosyltransferase